MRILNFLKTNNDKHKSVRIKTEIDDKFLNVNLDQTYESLDILSLKIFQKDVYRLFDADYGIIVGRVLGQGVGIPNCRVSIFIPIDEQEISTPTTIEDISKIEAAALYPYQTVFDKDGNGKIYNLLPKYSKNRNINGFPDNDYGIGATPKTPVGTFPEKEEILVNETLVYVYDKYLRYTTVTNESGDYILTVPANKTYTVNMSCDITDIGKFSTTPALLKKEGYPDIMFKNNGTTMNEDIDIERLPNIDIQNTSINVKPLWTQNTDNTYVGINRLDFKINKKIKPFSTVIGNYFAPNKKSWWGDRIAFRMIIGLRNLCVTIFGNCTPADSNAWILVWLVLQTKVCIDAYVLTWTATLFDIRFNSDPGGPPCNSFRFCLGFRIRYVLPYFNILFNENRFCTLNGGKAKYEAWDIRFILANVCKRDDALKILGGELTDGLFIQTHETGNIDIKTFNIKNTIDDDTADILNNLSLTDKTTLLNYNRDKDIELLNENLYVKYINDGNFIILLENNRYKVITNENGDLIKIDDNSDTGVFTKYRGYFYLTHLENPDNPPTQNRTGRIALKIPQYFDYNQNVDNWIWKHFTFEAGEIYSVAQKNEVRYDTFSTTEEDGDDDMIKPTTPLGFDEQTNILYTGLFYEANENNNAYQRNNNAYKTYNSFYNHITTLGIDTPPDGYNNGETTETDTPIPVTPPSFKPIGFELFKSTETNFNLNNKQVGWTMIDNNPISGFTDLKAKIVLSFASDAIIPVDKDMWDFTFTVQNQQAIDIILGGHTLGGANANILCTLNNIAPSQTGVNSDNTIYKIFSLTIPYENFYYLDLTIMTGTSTTYRQIAPLSIKVVLSNGYNPSSSISIERKGLVKYNPPYDIINYSSDVMYKPY